MIVAEEQFVPRGTAIADVRTPEFFTGPFLLIRKQHDLGHGVIDKDRAVFADKVVGISGRRCSTTELSRIDRFITGNATTLRAYVAACSACLYHQKATSAGTDDIFALPMPHDGDLDMSVSEHIVAHDLVDYYRDLVRFADDSDALKNPAIRRSPISTKPLLAQSTASTPTTR